MKQIAPFKRLRINVKVNEKEEEVYKCDHDPVSDDNLLRNPTSMLRFYTFRKYQFFSRLGQRLRRRTFSSKVIEHHGHSWAEQAFYRHSNRCRSKHLENFFLCLREFSLNSHLKFRRRAKKSNEY